MRRTLRCVTLPPDLRAPTPSAAAELAAPDRADLHIQLFELQAAMKRALQRRVEENRRHLLAIRQSRSIGLPRFTRWSFGG